MIMKITIMKSIHYGKDSCKDCRKNSVAINWKLSPEKNM